MYVIYMYMYIFKRYCICVNYFMMYICIVYKLILKEYSK